ncbi:MAG: hypothetical protein ACRDT4_17285 [Micromonosporaceae bacterium]
MSGTGDPHTVVKQELLVRYLDAWTPTVLKSHRRATYLEVSRDGSAAAALQVFGEFADRLAGHQLELVILGAPAPEGGTPPGLTVRTVTDPETIEVPGPMLAHLDLVGDSPLDEPAAWRLATRLAEAGAELLLTLPPVDATLVTGHRRRLADAGLRYAVHVELTDDAGQAQLLLFATAAEKHLAGFKEALWAADEYAGIRYRDPRDANGTLVDISLSPQLLPLRRELEHVLAERVECSVAELQRHALIETIYRPADAIRVVNALVSAGKASREPTKGRLSPRTVVRRG